MGTGPSDDFYALLGIDAAADAVELRRAWRRLALRWHPDRAGPGATAMFQKILAAYLVLSDPIERAAYDRRRSLASAGPRRRAPGVMLQRLSGPLNALITSGVARRSAGDVIELLLDAKEAAEGGMVTISMHVEVSCRACAAEASDSCPRCGGSGVVDELFSAWLAIRPGVTDGAVLTPSVLLRGMVRPVTFQVRCHHADAPRDRAS